MLQEAVIIAGNDAGPDIGGHADLRVADIGQVIDLGALLERRVLDLDEIPDPRTPGNDRTRSKPREGTDRDISPSCAPSR